MRTGAGLGILAVVGALLVAGCSGGRTTPAGVPVKADELFRKLPGQAEVVVFIDLRALRDIPELHGLEGQFLTSAAQTFENATGNAVLGLVDGVAMSINPRSFAGVFAGRFQELQGTVLQASLSAAANDRQEYRNTSVFEFSMAGYRSAQALMDSQTLVVADSSPHVREVIDTIRDRSGSAYDDPRLRQALSSVGPGYLIAGGSANGLGGAGAASGLSDIDSPVIMAQALSLKDPATSTVKYYARFESAAKAEAAVKAFEDPKLQAAMLGWDAGTRNLVVKRDGDTINATFTLANSEVRKKMGGASEGDQRNATEMASLQTAMMAMMADSGISSVPAQPSPVSDFSLWPKGWGTRPLYPNYLRDGLTACTYTWDSRGAVTQQACQSGASAPPPTPTATSIPSPTATRGALPTAPAPWTVTPSRPPIPTPTVTLRPVATSTPRLTPSPTPTKMQAPTATASTTTSGPHKFNTGDRFVWDSTGAYATVLDVGMIGGELQYTYTVTKGGQVIGPQSSLVSYIDNAGYQKIAPPTATATPTR